MDILFNFDSVLHLAAATLGILSGVVLLFFGFSYNPSNQPLGFSQLSTGLLIWSIFLGKSGLILQWPFWFRLGPLFVLICIPMSYLHVVFYTQKRSWKWYDIFHIVPIMIYVVDHWNILMMPAADKVRLIQQEVGSPGILFSYMKITYFGPLFHFVFRAVLFSLYGAASVVVFGQWLRNRSSLTRVEIVWRNWAGTFLGFQLLTLTLIYLRLLELDIIALQLANSYSAFFSLIVTLAMFFIPSILYGPKLAGVSAVIPLEKVNGIASLAEAEQQKLKNVLNTMDKALDERGLFLTAGYGINAFSKDINIPVYQVTKALNMLRGISFVDYINKKRIQYCLSKLNQQEWGNYTLEAVATECGFSNRNTFTQAFNKFSGVSPSVYRRHLKKLVMSSA